MKKGISLIVLVITIIVMIIIAGAIIISLNSSNVTNKANWAQVSSDRANYQAEFATILANVMAEEKVGDDYVGTTVTDVTGHDLYTNWNARVVANPAGFTVSVPADDTNPAGIKVVLTLTKAEADAIGLTYNADGSVVTGYDWVTVSGVTSGS